MSNFVGIPPYFFLRFFFIISNDFINSHGYLKLTALVDLVCRCGLEKRSLHIDIFTMRWPSNVGCSPSEAKKW